MADWSQNLEHEDGVLLEDQDQLLLLPRSAARTCTAQRGLSFMAGASSSKVTSVTQTSSNTGSNQLLHEDERFFFTVVSENMNSYTLLGTQPAKFDLMVHQYIPSQEVQDEDQLTLVPFGLPMVLRLRDESLEDWGKAVSVWHSDRSQYLILGSTSQVSKMSLGLTISKLLLCSVNPKYMVYSI